MSKTMKTVWLVCILHLLITGQVIPKIRYQFFTPGDTTYIQCPSRTRNVFWEGPPKADTFSTIFKLYNISNIYNKTKELKTVFYGSGITVNQRIINAKRIKVYKVRETFLLEILNTSVEDEGLYVCDSVHEWTTITKQFILLQKTRKPSYPLFKNMTDGDYLTCIEKKPLSIICKEDVALPPCTLTLLRNGEIIGTNETGKINYDIIPTREDVNITIRCVCDNSYWNITVSRDVVLDILYPPDVQVELFPLEDANNVTVLRCVAHGIPANYRYGLWEHRSFFGEHIRYLNSTDDKLILPFTQLHGRKQGSGIYTCHVTNGVANLEGNMFQNGSLSFKSQRQLENLDNTGFIVTGVAVSFVLLILLFALTVFVIVKRKRDQSRSAEESIDIEGEIIPFENRLYGEIPNEQGYNNAANPSPASTQVQEERI